MPRWTINFSGAHVDLNDRELLQLNASIEAHAGLLDQILLPSVLQAKVNRLNIMRAVRGTTGIEGADLTEDEVHRVLDAPTAARVLGDQKGREEREVRNARDVMERIVAIVAEDAAAELSEAHLLELHRLTTEGIEYGSNVPGRYRQTPVTVGSYMPPTADELPVLMDRFFEWFARTGPAELAWREPVRAIAAHFYLISIHPFVDGNGRTSRAIESLVLYRGGINTLGFYSLANFYYRNRAQYEELLDRTRFVHDGDMTDFVRYALTGLLQELKAVHSETLRELNAVTFRELARERIESGGPRRQTAERLLDLTLAALHEPIALDELRHGGHPLSPRYRDALRTLQRDVSYLKERGLLTEEAGVLRANIDVRRNFPS